MSEAGKVMLVRVCERRSSLHSISCDHPMTSSAGMTKGQSAGWMGSCVETGEIKKTQESKGLLGAEEEC